MSNHIITVWLDWSTIIEMSFYHCPVIINFMMSLLVEIYVYLFIGIT